MRWLKTIPAITICAVAVSAVVTALVDPLVIPRWAQQFFNWLLPGRTRSFGLDLATDALVGAIIAIPGVIVAITLILCVLDRNPGETRCRRCGRRLKGLTKPRCPDCGEAI